MKQYLTRKNIGMAMAILFAIPILLSAIGKLSGAQEPLEMLGSNNLGDWVTIIGIGELVSLILFLIPKTMRLGAMLLAAYWGGAIMFHMAHPNEELSSFTAGAVFFTLTLVISWVRGMELIDLDKKK